MKSPQNGFASVILLVLIILAVGAYLIFTNTPEVKTIDTPIKYPKENIESFTPPSSVLFDHGDFSFTYLDSLQLQQGGNNVLFWKAEYTPNNYVDASMFLRWSNNPFPPLTKGKTFDLYEDVYPGDTLLVSIEALEESTVELDSETTKMYTINCGVDCYYHAVRFQTPLYYYELVSDGAGGGLQTRFENILATFKKHDIAKGETKIYWNSDALFTFETPISTKIYENVRTSADGVILFGPGVVKIMPIDARALSISYKKLDREISLDEYVKENVTCSTIYEKSMGLVDGEKAILTSTACGLEGSLDIFTIHNGYLYTFNEFTFEDPLLKTFTFSN